ncbi:MAG: SUMF1/EgtB/PvdO family nonheme iron enzyme [Symploca sp. SIO2G7]|nr:SUMF1/EgtB/PvdO family nonheme iron enzyme [Symploca sp. SIO2G7]
MNNRFALAAKVLLARRLNNLRRIDKAVEIDISYITCAEYQLFIDAQKLEGKYVQPDHWISDQFPVGTAKQPITGVRGSNAVAFCEWLTNQQFTPGFQYRLPTVVETEKYPSAHQALGCWCIEGQALSISSIPTQQLHSWLEEIKTYSSQDNLATLNRALILSLTLTIASTQNVALYCASRPGSRASGMRYAYKCARAFKVTLDRTRILDRMLNLDLKRASERALTLDKAWERILALSGELRLHTPNRTIAKELVNDINHASELACASMIDFARALDLAQTIGLEDILNGVVKCFHTRIELATPDTTALLSELLSTAEIDLDLNLSFDLNSAKELISALTSGLITVYNFLDVDNPVDVFTSSYAPTFVSDHKAFFDTDYWSLRAYVLCLFMSFNLFSKVFARIAKTSKFMSFLLRINKERYLEVADECSVYRKQAAQLYTFFVLIELRQQSKMPAWEGIRIVRERVNG